MVPRRKRTVLDDSDSEEERVREQRKTTLRNFFSPNSESATAAASALSPSASAADRPVSTSTKGPQTPSRGMRSKTAGAKTPTKSPLKNSKAAVSPATSSPFNRILSSQSKDGSKKNGTANGTNGDKSPCPSPDKRRGSTKGQAADEKGKSADLVALFTKQAEKARNSPLKKSVSIALDEITSDPISDDEIGDDEIADSSAVVASYVGSRVQKRQKNNTYSQQISSSLPSSLAPPSLPPPHSQRFRRPIQSAASNEAGSKLSDDDSRPWSERFAPTNLDELAVHKKKVADVRRWLEDVMRGRLRQRLLILKGAAGTGKTTTIRLLAKDMDLDILEWRNPTGASAAGARSLGFTSAAAQFDEFLNRGSRFTQLDLGDANSDSESGDTESTKRTNGTTGGTDTRLNRKIIVIEEFPNTFMRSSSALTWFRNSVLQYLATNTPSLAAYAHRRPFDLQTITPVIMIVSEALLTTTSASADSFTAHRLLGPEILRHPGTGMIEFNAIAPSFLAKALELVVQKEARKSGRRRTPGPLVLKRLGEVGDVRSAIGSLEFLCVKGDDQGDWGAKVAFTKSRRGPRDAALTKGEKETLEMVSQREASLGMFHAVGKVVYNKRDGLAPLPDSDEAMAEMLPDYSAHHSRPKPSLVAVDALIDETGTDTHTFISALHENYVLSCESTGPQDPMSSIDYVNGCIEYLSESDLLCPTWDIFFGGRGSNRYNFGRDSGSHVLRQDEMAFQVAVRGLLFSLPSPVKRASGSSYQRGTSSSNGGDYGNSNNGGSGGGNQFKMFYPMYLKLWRNREELEALVDLWSSKLLQGEATLYAGGSQSTHNNPTNRALSFRKPVAKFSSSGQASDRNQAGAQRLQRFPKAPGNGTDKDTMPAITKEGAEDGLDDEEAPSALLSLGRSARKELILERLPYMALIGRAKRCSFGSMGMRDLEKVVSFHGVGAAAAGADDVDEDAADANFGIGSSAGIAADDAWATDKPTDDASPRKARRPPVPDGRRPMPSGSSRTGEAVDTGDLSSGLPIYKLVLSDDDIEDVDSD